MMAFALCPLIACRARPIWTWTALAAGLLVVACSSDTSSTDVALLQVRAVPDGPVELPAPRSVALRRPEAALVDEGLMLRREVYVEFPGNDESRCELFFGRDDAYDSVLVDLPPTRAVLRRLESIPSPTELGFVVRWIAISEEGAAGPLLASRKYPFRIASEEAAEEARQASPDADPVTYIELLASEGSSVIVSTYDENQDFPNADDSLCEAPRTLPPGEQDGARSLDIDGDTFGNLFELNGGLGLEAVGSEAIPAMPVTVARENIDVVLSGASGAPVLTDELPDTRGSDGLPIGLARDLETLAMGVEVPEEIEIRLAASSGSDPLIVEFILPDELIGMDRSVGLSTVLDGTNLCDSQPAVPADRNAPFPMLSEEGDTSGTFAIGGGVISRCSGVPASIDFRLTVNVMVAASDGSPVVTYSTAMDDPIGVLIHPAAESVAPQGSTAR